MKDTNYDLELLDLVFNLAISNCFSEDIHKIDELYENIKKLKVQNEQLKAELDAMKELDDLTEDDIPWLRGEDENE